MKRLVNKTRTTPTGEWAADIIEGHHFLGRVSVYRHQSGLSARVRDLDGREIRTQHLGKEFPGVEKIEVWLNA